MPKWSAALAVVVVAVLGAGLVAFEPWRALTSSTVDEALPNVITDGSAGQPARAEADPVPTTRREGRSPRSLPISTPSPLPSPLPSPTPVPAPEVVVLASGTFVEAEHSTTGLARIIELADGSRFVRLEDFSTSDGPDVFVGLSDAPSGGAWGSYDDGRYEQLGALKATDGNQNYEIPADVDLAGFESVVIWCDRFDVAFGTAAVTL